MFVWLEFAWICYVIVQPKQSGTLRAWTFKRKHKIVFSQFAGLYRALCSCTCFREERVTKWCSVFMLGKLFGWVNRGSAQHQLAIRKVDRKITAKVVVVSCHSDFVGKLLDLHCSSKKLRNVKEVIWNDMFFISSLGHMLVENAEERRELLIGLRPNQMLTRFQQAYVVWFVWVSLSLIKRCQEWSLNPNFNF